MQLSGLDYLAAGGAALAAGAINALAGGGTLVSFPALVGLGVPAVSANVTNTVALVPGYLGGSWAQRDDLRHQLGDARALSVVGAAGGLAGSVLLVTIPAHAFRVAVPYLILLSCLLLLSQERIRARIDVGPPGVDAGTGTGAVAPEASASTRPEERVAPRPALLVSVFAAAVYGGFFGAGLGIMLLAILGIFSHRALNETNALKQAMSFVINLVAAVFFAFSGHVRWSLVPVMAAASVLGGIAGGRMARVVSPSALRAVVVVAGVGVAAAFWAG